jgi:hypothetical protein
MRRAILIAVVLCSFVVGANAEDYGIDFVNGNQLYEKCQEFPSYCHGYATGVAVASDQEGNAFCLPPGVNSLQLRDTVKLWLRDHPEKRHLSGSFLVIQALKEKFPCN